MDNNELDLNLDELDQLESNADNKLKVKNRFQQLANDKRELAQKNEAEAKARTEAEARAKEAESKLEFFKNFSTVTSKYPGAAEFQDQILERVAKGIDIEEAAIGILAKEGKYQAPPQPQQPITPAPRAEGGSSINIMAEPKGMEQMNSNDMLDSLKELEKTGDLQQALRGGINIAG